MFYGIASAMHHGFPTCTSSFRLALLVLIHRCKSSLPICEYDTILDALDLYNFLTIWNEMLTINDFISNMNNFIADKWMPYYIGCNRFMGLVHHSELNIVDDHYPSSHYIFSVCYDTKQSEGMDILCPELNLL